MADVRQQLVDYVEDWYRIFPSGDAAALAALYTSDARLMLANLPAVSGAEAIGALLGSFTKYVDLTIRHEVSEVEVIADDLAIVTGAGWVESVPKRGGDAHRDASRFVMLMQKAADGRWLCHYDVSQPTPDVAFAD